MKSFFLLLFASALALTACRKESDLDRPEFYTEANFKLIFEAYWNGMNNNYVFWDIDTTDWDRVYRQYHPLFAQLKYGDSTDERKAYTYFSEIAGGLVDGHYVLSCTSPYLRDSSWIVPQWRRISARPDFHQPIPIEHFYYTVPQYLDAGSHIGYAEVPNGEPVAAITGTINNQILYLFFSSFDLETLYKDKAGNDVKQVLETFFDRVENTADLKGVILDVRGNAGGRLSDLNFLMGRFIRQPLHFGYTKVKTGNGRLDYSPWIPANVTPHKSGKQIAAPIVIIADLHSMSMSEITAMAVKSLPNGHLIGERTGGATGPLYSKDIFTNSGVFFPPFFEDVYTSSVPTKYRDGKSYEGIGFPPDVTIPYDKAVFDAGKDPQLEGAISLINR